MNPKRTEITFISAVSYIGSIHYKNNMYSDLWVRLCSSVPDLENQPEYQTHKMVNLTVNLNRPDKPCNLSFLSFFSPSGDKNIEGKS